MGRTKLTGFLEPEGTRPPPHHAEGGNPERLGERSRFDVQVGSFTYPVRPVIGNQERETIM